MSKAGRRRRRTSALKSEELDMSPLLAPLNPVVCGKRAVVQRLESRQPVPCSNTDLSRGRAERGRPRSGSLSEHLTRVFFCSIMILPQVHLRKPCYDFCPVQATAIKAVSTEAKTRKSRQQQSPLFSKRLSPGQRRAVCTKGRDVINAS